MKHPYDLKDEELKAYRRGFGDGNESNYYPACADKELAAYDWGYKDGQKHGPRHGKPWTLSELLMTKK